MAGKPVKILKLHISVHNEYDSGGLDIACVELNPNLIKRIRQLNQAVIKFRAYCIEEFEYSPEFLTEDGEEPEARPDCITLKVEKDRFLWTGYIKHTSVTWETESVPIKELII